MEMDMIANKQQNQARERADARELSTAEIESVSGGSFKLALPGSPQWSDGCKCWVKR